MDTHITRDQELNDWNKLNEQKFAEFIKNQKIYTSLENVKYVKGRESQRALRIAEYVRECNVMK